ncbi:hypothetical protein CORT_0A04940 [Candida orthopsilosis Co 90-125]|uniref:Uncharacterized protein n=1 Tax=Candida orthopsilosis (strain 90-125) TaxID=1136231 RepID=H8WXT5_CANO9|nr:hypothetical protein CORT_0A04940 [Candida orthopsilosis Co 90-125]CCG20882.1 hypothetical protein CORT_0A04940 [Candida orthopsilosis Co 90-125]
MNSPYTTITMEMNESLTDRLAIAVIHWISEFSDSPLKADAPPASLTDAVVLFKLFKVLLNKEDFKSETLEFALFSTTYEVARSETSITVPLPLWSQIDVLSWSLAVHLKKHASSVHPPQLDLYKLIILKESEQLRTLCQILIVLGTFSSRLASRGQAFIEFLPEEDRILLKRYDILQQELDYRAQRQRFNSLTPTSLNQDQNSFDAPPGPDSGESCYVITEEELRAIKWECQVFNQVINRISFEKKQQQLNSLT